MAVEITPEMQEAIDTLKRHGITPEIYRKAWDAAEKQAAPPRVQLTAEEALAMLDDEFDYIHTFTGGGGMMMGCDYPKADLEKLILESSRRELAGEMAARMDHRLAILDGKSWLFVQTKAAVTA